MAWGFGIITWFAIFANYPTSGRVGLPIKKKLGLHAWFVPGAM